MCCISMFEISAFPFLDGKFPQMVMIQEHFEVMVLTSCDSFQYKKKSSVFDVLALVKNEMIVTHQIQPSLSLAKTIV